VRVSPRREILEQAGQLLSVIPVETGIKSFQVVAWSLDSRLRGNDGPILLFLPIPCCHEPKYIFILSGFAILSLTDNRLGLY